MCGMAGHYRHTAVKALDEQRFGVLCTWSAQSISIRSTEKLRVNGLRLAEMLHSPAAGLLREQLASNGCLSM
jgi:hypothetical protein